MRVRFVLIACVTLLLLGLGYLTRVAAAPSPPRHATLTAYVPDRMEVVGPTSTTTTTVPVEDPVSTVPVTGTSPASEPAPSNNQNQQGKVSKPLTTQPRPSTDYSSLEPCGGAYPPCWVKRRESGGNYGAYNPTGCAWTDKSGYRHHGCYGAWQFGTMWAGRLGLPDDLSTATPEQQDEAARQLWAGGAGCSNWAAC